MSLATSPLQSWIHCNLAFALRPVSIGMRSAPWCSSAAHSDAAASSAAARVRDYPAEPRVGVGVVVLRHVDAAVGGQAEVLLIRRAKAPAKGLWCFPGGSLELGETLVQCAVRETREETGIVLRCCAALGGEEAGGGSAELYSDCLDWPSPIAAADSLTRDASGRLLYHYAIINLAAVPEVGGGAPLVQKRAGRASTSLAAVVVACVQDPRQQPVPSDDADAAQWFPVAQLRGLKGGTAAMHTRLAGCPGPPLSSHACISMVSGLPVLQAWCNTATRYRSGRCGSTPFDIKGLEIGHTSVNELQV